MHLVGFIIRIYHNAPSSECQTSTLQEAGSSKQTQHHPTSHKTDRQLLSSQGKYLIIHPFWSYIIHLFLLDPKLHVLLVTVKTQLSYESKVLQIWFTMGQHVPADTGPSSGQQGTYKITIK
jgi:hypothetical protein